MNISKGAGKWWYRQLENYARIGFISVKYMKNVLLPATALIDRHEKKAVITVKIFENVEKIIFENDFFYLL